MARIKIVTPTIGEGELRFSGFLGQAGFSMDGEPTALKYGIARMRGSIVVTPEVAAEAFREGEATLKLESGPVLRLTFLGHTADDGRVYFEARV